VDSGDAVLRTGNANVFNAAGLRVKLKVVQEPRVKPSVPEPQEDLVNCALTLEEVLFIKVRRGEKLTGFNVHQDNKGRYYFWCWGQQPDEPLLDRIADADPTVAAHRFLAIYEPGTGPNWGSFKQPMHKKPSPTLALEADL
jgi:hypothetical protein